jgi:hypothetical protein
MHLRQNLGSCNDVTEDSCFMTTKQLLLLTILKKCCALIFKVSSQTVKEVSWQMNAAQPVSTQAAVWH